MYIFGFIFSPNCGSLESLEPLSFLEEEILEILILWTYRSQTEKKRKLSKTELM